MEIFVWVDEVSNTRIFFELYEQIDVSQPSLSRRQVNALLEPVEDLEMIVATSLKTKMSFKKGAISNGKDRLPTIFFCRGHVTFCKLQRPFPAGWSP